MPNGDEHELWMDAHVYSMLSKNEKKDISAAVEIYDNEVAAAKKKLSDAVADIINGTTPLTSAKDK